MTAISRTSMTPIPVVLGVFVVVNAIDFMFYGQHLYNLAALIGLSVAAFGVARDQKVAINFGALIAIAATAAKYI